MSGPEPYYEHAGVTIYHGDAAEVLCGFGWYERGREDAVLVTDPPYGVNLGATKGSGGSHGLVRDGYASFDDTYQNFVSHVLPIIRTATRMTARAGIFSGPHIHEQEKPDAIGGVFCPAAAGRTSWGFKNFLPVLLYGSAPNLHLGATTPTAIQSVALAARVDHPCPKPLPWMEWLVRLTSKDSDTILDPFMGSGTTLRAAKDLGRKAIGIEIEERYCEIAAKRLAQEVFEFGEKP